LKALELLSLIGNLVKNLLPSYIASMSCQRNVISWFRIPEHIQRWVGIGRFRASCYVCEYRSPMT